MSDFQLFFLSLFDLTPESACEKITCVQNKSNFSGPPSFFSFSFTSFSIYIIMTEHYSPMSITQLIHTHEESNLASNVPLATETLDHPLSPTLSGFPKKSPGITLPPLFVPPSSASTTPLASPTSISDPPRFSFSSDTTLSAMEDDYHQLNDADQDQQQQHQQPFINRVSNMSLVNSALRAYEQSTAQNVMKYGSDMVESFTGPIYDKFGKGSGTNVMCNQRCMRMLLTNLIL